MLYFIKKGSEFFCGMDDDEPVWGSDNEAATFHILKHAQNIIHAYRALRGCVIITRPDI